jgi:hypothetical protein
MVARYVGTSDSPVLSMVLAECKSWCSLRLGCCRLMLRQHGTYSKYDSHFYGCPLGMSAQAKCSRYRLDREDCKVAAPSDERWQGGGCGGLEGFMLRPKRAPLLRIFTASLSMVQPTGGNKHTETRARGRHLANILAFGRQRRHYIIIIIVRS